MSSRGAPLPAATRARCATRCALAAPAVIAALALGTAPAAATGPDADAGAAASEPEGRVVFDAGWDDGITYEFRQHLRVVDDLGAPGWIDDVAVKGRIGGSLYLDGGWLGGPPLDEGLRGAVRRARLYTRGHLVHWLDTEYKVEFAVSGSRFLLNDFYLRWRPDRFVDSIRFGYFDPPASLQTLVASGSRALMEVGSPVAAFTPGFRLGIEAAGVLPDPSLTWCVDLTSVGQTSDVGDASHERLRLFGRAVWRPFGPPRTDRPLLHLGLSATYSSDTGDASIRHRSRPESFLAPYLVDTGDIEGGGGVVGVEAAWRDGPRVLQWEGFVSAVDGTQTGGLVFYGFYLQAAWSLTGEVRGYDAAQATFQRVKPLRDLSLRGPGLGALELAARLSWVDLSDGGVHGGRMLSFTIGPAWTWNRFVRVLAGYVVADVFDRPRDGVAHVFQMRLELAL